MKTSHTNPAECPTAFEVCSSCSQRTAAQFFREVKKKRLCALCAQRSDDAAASSRERIDDIRLHAGLGWLWKHLAFTAAVTIVSLLVRFIRFE